MEIIVSKLGFDMLVSDKILDYLAYDKHSYFWEQVMEELQNNTLLYKNQFKKDIYKYGILQDTYHYPIPNYYYKKHIIMYRYKPYQNYTKNEGWLAQFLSTKYLYRLVYLENNKACIFHNQFRINFDD